MADNSSAMEGARAAGRATELSQPTIGFLVLAVILVVGFLLSYSIGPVKATLVLGPITTVWLPFLVMNAVWWRGWPFSRLSQPWSGIANLILQIVLVAIGTVLMQALVVGSVNFAEMFNPPFRMFPFLMPMAALVFGVMLHLTFVVGQWPYRNLEYRLAGVAAVVTAWIIGGILYVVLCNWNSLPKEALGSAPNPGGLYFAMDTTGAVIWVIAWQMVLGVLLGGWPVRLIKNTATNLIVSTLAVLVLGVVSYLILNAIIGGAPVVALGATSIFGAFVWAMAMETWPLQGRMIPARAIGLVALAFVTAVVWFFILTALAMATAVWPPDLPPQIYVGIGSLNFFTAIIVLYYTIFHRWPFTPPAPPPSNG